MSIGVRITSNNLSGKTANVLFAPLSGGTQNLGSKVIPFNNITTYPYGEYAIYVPEYDYTYTLNVTETLGQNQSYVVIGNQSGSTNFSLASLNFNDFTGVLIDFGIDATYWNYNNIYMITEGGYMILFNNGFDWLVLFTNLNGDVIDQYSATTSNYSYDTIDGNILYFKDGSNGVLKYFNGINVYEFTYDQATENLNIEWDWDGTCEDKSFFFKLQNTGTTTTTLYKVSYNGSVLAISSWDYTTETRYYGPYVSSNYFYELTKDSANYLLSLKIYDTSGNEVSSTTFGVSTYNSWDLRWYANQQFNMVCWDSNDINTQYVIINFDGVSLNTIMANHPRGTNYQNINSYSDTNFYPENSETGGVFMIFHGTTGNFAQGAGLEVGYLDLVYRLDGDSNFSTYTYTDTGTYDKRFDIWAAYTGGYKNFYTICSTGDSISSVFSITTEGVKTTPTGLNFTDIGSIYLGIFGDYYYYFPLTNSSTTGNLFVYLTGNQINTETFDLGSGWDLNSDYQTFYICDTTKGFYINNSVTGLTSTNVYLNGYTSYSYYTPNYYERNGNIFIMNWNTGVGRVLTRFELLNEFSLPPYNGDYEIRIGRDRILYTYFDNSNQVRINLYNFNGALMSSVITNINSWNNTYAGKDRYVVTQFDGSQYTYTMMSDGGYNQVTIDDLYTNSWQINDYILWD